MNALNPDNLAAAPPLASQAGAPPLADRADLTGRERALLRFFYAFAQERDRSLVQLLGPKIRPADVVRAMLAMVMVEFAADREVSSPQVEHALARFGGKDVIRQTLAALQNQGLLSLIPNERDRRTRFVMPTAHLVAWYRREMLDLENTVESLIELSRCRGKAEPYQAA